MAHRRKPSIGRIPACRTGNDDTFPSRSLTGRQCCGGGTGEEDAGGGGGGGGARAASTPGVVARRTEEEEEEEAHDDDPPPPIFPPSFASCGQYQRGRREGKRTWGFGGAPSYNGNPYVSCRSSPSSFSSLFICFPLLFRLHLPFSFFFLVFWWWGWGWPGEASSSSPLANTKGVLRVKTAGRFHHVLRPVGYRSLVPRYREMGTPPPPPPRLVVVM